MNLPLLRVAIEQYPQLAELGTTAVEPYRRLAVALGQRHLGRQQVGGAELLAAFVLGERVAESLHALPDSLVEEVVARWRGEAGEQAIARALEAVASEFETALDDPARARGPKQPAESPRRALELLLLLWWLNRNPALAPVRELFDDRRLGTEPAYQKVVGSLLASLEQAAAERGGLGRELVEGLLLSSADSSLISQLELASQDLWTGQGGSDEIATTVDSGPGSETGDQSQGADDIDRLLRARDLVLEELPRLPPGPPQAEPPRLSWAGERWAPRQLPEPPPEPPEEAWMMRLALVAKHAKVWLHQLARSLGKERLTLDQIPRRELERLAEQGITGLWLIGVWQRSPASREIKQRLGARDIDASAYSIFDYRVARDLGGDDAMDALQERALEYGIRIGVDVVPNHFGLDSEWVRHHPERFLGLDTPPYPNYDFDGPDLSGDPDIGLFLERHYYDQSDAAVVFRRLDRCTGEERFLYHGNDGTGTAWNDTAQLDYLQPEVRRAMSDLILGLARRFPILRFDAAMTLTRFHYQRLWFPPPGHGGAIPSRSEHGMSVESFEHQMPQELWREIVERAVGEAPGALLIAEAFWLMEGYFVRELGMHRVYNSAFMHQLRDHDDSGFRRLLAETEATDPALLGRFVSFLSNPDERTASDQFGDGDRYFGICALLATLPGLPLFAHGQIGGLKEKYGMEFARPRTEETDDAQLVERHCREIVPLLEHRQRFASGRAFRLLRFFEQGRAEAQWVIAFRNGDGMDSSERPDLAIVVFNHGNAAVSGVLGGDLLPGDLASLVAPGEEARGRELRFRELRSERAFERSLSDIVARGLELELGPYQCLVLVLEDGDGVAAEQPQITAPSGTSASLGTITMPSRIA